LIFHRSPLPGAAQHEESGRVVTSDDAESIDQLLEELRRMETRSDPALLDRIRGLGLAAVPSLIAYATDPEEYEVREDAEITGWGPYSAIDLLGELHPMEALQPLVSLLPWEDYDFLGDPLIHALGQFGRPAMEPVTAVLADRSQIVWSRGTAAEALEKMALAYPELRNEVVATLTAQLETDEADNDGRDILRGFLLQSLLELQAEESLPSIIRAFEESDIDPFMVAWSDVRHELGVPLDVATHLDESSPDRGSLFDFLPLMPASDQPSISASPLPAGQIAEPYQRESVKVGRNDPCPCGSGKKYKKCCGR